MDKEIQKKIVNCSRCGLCMEVCPVYRVKMTETSTLRGKFLQLKGVIEGDLKYDKKIAYNIDLCLGCGKCQKACPSGLNAVEVFSAVRNEHQSFFERLFYGSFAFKLKMLALRFFFNFHNSKAKLKLPKNCVHFKGCATCAVQGGKSEFSCCGLPFYIKGRFDLYEKYKKRNLKLFQKYDKIIFDCATCYDTVLAYEGVDKSKLAYFTDYYKNSPLFSKKNYKAAFHRPCHMNDNTYNDIKSILKSIGNIEFIDFEGQEDCCGFGGDFFTRHGNTAIYLSKQKVQNVLNSGANIVLTSCPTCLLSLKFGINAIRFKEKRKIDLKALDLVEFLSGL